MSCHLTQIYRHDYILGPVSELCAELFESWGIALADMVPPQSRITVACDFRKDSTLFKKALIRGLVDRGIQVVDLGMVPTDLVVYGCERTEAAGLAIVTGGARPGDWNGLRWNLIDSSLPYPEQIQRLKDETERRGPSEHAEMKRTGTVQTLDISCDWIDWLQTVWYDAPDVSYRILLDPMHGSWSRLARRAMQAVFPKMVFEAIHDEPEENFGGRTPCSQEVKSLAEPCAEVDLRRATLGFVLDADGGCFSMIDDQGIPFRPEETAWLILHYLLGEAMQDEIFLHDVNCSEILLAEGKRLGGRPVLVSRHEESFIDEMKRTDALIGLNSNGEIFFRGVRGHRIVVFAICWFLDFLSRIKLSLSELRTAFPTFFTTSEFRTPLAPLKDVAERLSRCWKTSPELTLEGIRFILSAGRLHIRTIADDAQLGFHFESSDRETLRQFVEECSDALDDLGQVGFVLGKQFQAENAARFFPD